MDNMEMNPGAVPPPAASVCSPDWPRADQG